MIVLPLPKLGDPPSSHFRASPWRHFRCCTLTSEREGLACRCWARRAPLLVSTLAQETCRCCLFLASTRALASDIDCPERAVVDATTRGWLRGCLDREYRRTCSAVLRRARMLSEGRGTLVVQAASSAIRVSLPASHAHDAPGERKARSLWALRRLCRGPPMQHG